MEVLYWQIAVAGSVVVAYYFAPRRWWAVGAAVLWTIWTLGALTYSPLVLLQTISAWGALFVAHAFSKQSRELQSFKRAIAEYDGDKMGAFLRARQEGKVTPLMDADHYSYLLKQFELARSSVVILSGWISDSVVDDQFVAALLRALHRGVDVYIGYGFQDGQGQHQLSEAAKRALTRLNRAGIGQPRLRVGKFNNHQKLLIVDQTRVVCGSHNWLSNRTFMNREKSFIIADRAVAEASFAYVVPQITANPAAAA